MNKELGIKNNKKIQGFTLVEMIVSLGIFAVVATVSLGALVNIVSANKKAQALQATITNLNFALETISREMRVGSTYACYDFVETIETAPLLPRACGIDPNPQIAFESSKKLDAGGGSTCQAVIAYRFLESTPGQYTLQKAEQEQCNVSIIDTDFKDFVSSEDVIINDARMSVSAEPYPLAFIKISGYAGVRERERTYFDVQTAVSPRAVASD